MTSTKRTTRKAIRPAKITVGVDLPEVNMPGATGGPPAHWVEVAQSVKANPGEWCDVSFAHMSPKANQSAASGINAASRDSNSKTGKNRAFAEPGYTAAYRDGRLYVRYDQPAAGKVRAIGKRTA